MKQKEIIIKNTFFFQFLLFLTIFESLSSPNFWTKYKKELNVSWDVKFNRKYIILTKQDLYTISVNVGAQAKCVLWCFFHFRQLLLLTPQAMIQRTSNFQNICLYVTFLPYQGVSEAVAFVQTFQTFEFLVTFWCIVPPSWCE